MLVISGAGSRVTEAQQRRVVEIVAERFSFTPSQVRVPVGTTLELRVRSEDTMHGFQIVGQSINVDVPKRRQAKPSSCSRPRNLAVTASNVHASAAPATTSCRVK